MEETWKELTNGQPTMSIRDFHQLYDKIMPRLCDREVALEVFQELDADKDGKITFKDFKDAMIFDL